MFSGNDRSNVVNTGTGTTTTGHTGVLGKIKNALDPNTDTTGATTRTGYAQPVYGAGTTGTTTTGPHHHLGRDAALGAGAVGVAEHHHHNHPHGTTTGAGYTGTGATTTASGTGGGVLNKIKNALDPNTSTTGTTGTGYGSGTIAYGTGTSGTTGTHHHVGRDAALGVGAVGVAEHEHHKHTHGTTTGAGHTGTGAGYGAGTTTNATGYNTTTLGAPTQPTTSHAKGLETKGKIQEFAGDLLHSRNMQAKGIANQQEAEATRMQAAELGEADRLEAEARLRRDRAVAGGAHPAHRTLGGPGSGTNY